MILSLEETFTVGEDTFFDSISPSSTFGVTFEDDLTTGYFYAVNTQPTLEFLNALHIYNVVDVIDKAKPCKLQIAWNYNGQIASLLINNYCHAIFDFEKRIGYSRNGFPERGKNWSDINNKILTDDLIDKILE